MFENPQGAKKLMTLYGYWRSGASWRVRLALGLKGFRMDGDDQQVEYIPINLFKNEHDSALYAKLNPAKAVPTLIVHDDAVMNGK